MFYDPQYLENTQSGVDARCSGLTPTISKVQQESNRLLSEQGEYKSLLDELRGSAFLKAMKDLQNSVIE